MWVNIVLFILAILAAIFFIPWVLKRLQEKQNKRLTKALLRKWGDDCIAAIMLLKPAGKMIEIEDYPHSAGPGHYDSDLPIWLFWEDIKEGRKDPEGAAKKIHDAFSNVLFSDEERTMKSIPNLQYPVFSGDITGPSTMIKRIMNPMYAKLEIFELESLPINELEVAMGCLDTFKQSGYMERTKFISYAYHLAQSMEKFAKYLWKLENRQQKTEITTGDTKMDNVKNWFLRKWNYVQNVVGWKTVWLSLFTAAFVITIVLLFTIAILFYFDSKLAFSEMGSYTCRGIAATLVLVASIISAPKQWVVRVLIIAIEFYIAGMLLDLFNLVDIL